MRGKWTALQCTNNSKMSTERGESDGRQQHEPGSDDITANKTWASTTKGPLLVYLDLHIVLTLSAYQAVLFSRVQSRICYLQEHGKGNTHTGMKGRKRGKHFSQHNNGKCSFICENISIYLFVFGSLTFFSPHAEVLVTAISIEYTSYWLVGFYFHLQRVDLFNEVYSVRFCCCGTIRRM